MFNNLTKGCQDLVSGLCEGHHSGGLGPILLGIGCTSVGVKDALKIARQSLESLQPLGGLSLVISSLIWGSSGVLGGSIVGSAGTSPNHCRSSVAMVSVSAGLPCPPWTDGSGNC